MAFSELAITDVFPMRKRRAVDSGTTKLNSKRGLDNAKGEQTKPNSCISKTPNSKVSSTTTIPRRNAAKSPKGRNDTQLPLHTPTRLNFPPSDALGRLRKTPQRLAAWRNLSPYDSGPEIIWDNDCISPTSTFNQAKGRDMSSSRSTQGQLASLIREIAKTNKRSLNKDETNLFQVWMKKDDGETSTALMPTDEDYKKKRSILHRSDSGEHPRPIIHRNSRKRSRIRPCNVVKIKEELSNFIKDINEKVSTDVENVKDIVSGIAKKEIVQGVNGEEKRAEDGNGTSAQMEKVNGQIIIGNRQVNLDIIDDDGWLDFEEFPTEINGSDVSETDVVNEGKCLKVGQSQRMAGICDKIVVVEQFGSVEFCVDDNCEANGNVTKPDNEDKKGMANINMSKAKQPLRLRDDCIIQKGSNVAQFENQVEKIHNRSFNNVPKFVPKDCQKHRTVNEGNSTITEKNTQSDCLKSVARCNSNQTLADLEKKIDELNVEKMVVHNNKNESRNLRSKGRLDSCVKEVKAAPEFHENELDKLIMSEDEFVFDEIDDGNNDDLKEDFGVNDFDCYDHQNDLRKIENVENDTVKCLEIKHTKTLNDCKGDKDNRTNEDDLDDIDFDDCADLINEDCFSCFPLNEGPLVVSKNAESSVVDGMDSKSQNESDRMVNRYDRDKPQMKSEVERIKKSSSEQKNKASDNGRRRSVCGNDEFCNVRKKTTGWKFNKKRGVLIVDINKKTLNANAEVKTVKANEEHRRLKADGKSFGRSRGCYLDVGSKVDDYLDEECLAEHKSSLSDSVHNFDIDVHANKNEYNFIDNELIDVALDLEDWGDEMILDGDGWTADHKSGCEPDNAVKQDSRKATKIMNKTKNNCRWMSKDAEKSAKNTKGLGKELRSLKYDSGSAQTVRSGRNRLHNEKNEFINEQGNINITSMPNHHKTEVPLRAVDSIKYCNVKDRHSTAREPCITTKSDCKPKPVDFDISSITNEEAGNSVDVDDSNFWNDDPNPLEKISVPFTSTQKIDLQNKVSSGKGLQLCKTKTYNAEEIERKRIEAIERLKQRKLERRQIKMASSR